MRQPISRLEKFVDGLKKLLLVQPAATLVIKEGKLTVGDLSDPHLSNGLKDYLGKMGFYTENGTFVYDTKEEKTYGKF